MPDKTLRDKLYPTEDAYFKTNTHVGGMVADDKMKSLKNKQQGQ